jgi:hypothetical protein
MRGFELDKARKDRLDQLRRATQNELPALEALDRRFLLAFVTGGEGNARGNILSRALKLRALRQLGFTAAELGEAFKQTADEVEREASASLLADPSIARALEGQVREEIPETPERERYVEPTGNFAVPGVTYPHA